MNVIDYILSEVTLDERISDGIFRLDETTHMDALRDYLVKGGIKLQEAITMTNRMLEGKFPERQAYNKNGILCTFPSPEYKAAAIKRGSHFEKNPNPNATPVATPQEPTEKPIPPIENPTEKPAQEVPAQATTQPNIFQPEVPLKVEPLGANDAATSQPVPIAPVKTTPLRAAAEKQIVNQIISGDNNTLGSFLPPDTEKVLNHQLQEIYKHCNTLNFKEAINFLTPYIKS